MRYPSSAVCLQPPVAAPMYGRIEDWVVLRDPLLPHHLKKRKRVRLCDTAASPDESRPSQKREAAPGHLQGSATGR